EGRESSRANHDSNELLALDVSVAPSFESPMAKSTLDPQPGFHETQGRSAGPGFSFPAEVGGRLIHAASAEPRPDGAVVGIRVAGPGKGHYFTHSCCV